MTIEFPSAAQIPQLLQLWKTAFGEHNGFWEMFLDISFTPGHCRCIAAEGQVAAALYWFDCTCQGQKMAYIYAVVTHPDHRGKGLCRLLLEDVHRHLSAQGYSAAMLVPEGDSLRTMYRKLGYADCTSVFEFSCTAGTGSVPLRATGVEEYGMLRRAFLPKGGVIQEGKNLDFLAQQAQFYAGKDFLVAAYQEEDTLHAMELLGNTGSAPGILAALDCKTGYFRTPGKDKPFAMFHPLTEDAIVPSYFGFAFD